MLEDLVIRKRASTFLEKVLTCQRKHKNARLRHLLPHINPINCPSSDAPVGLSCFHASRKHTTDAAVNMEKTHAAFIYLRRIENISYGVLMGHKITSLRRSHSDRNPGCYYHYLFFRCNNFFKRHHSRYR